MSIGNQCHNRVQKHFDLSFSYFITCCLLASMKYMVFYYCQKRHQVSTCIFLIESVDDKFFLIPSSHVGNISVVVGYCTLDIQSRHAPRTIISALCFHNEKFALKILVATMIKSILKRQDYIIYYMIPHFNSCRQKCTYLR